jgi:hypothetical protein
MKQIKLYTEENLSNSLVLNIFKSLGIILKDEKITIKTVKSSWGSSFVDLVIEIIENGKVTNGYLIEITQSTDKDSRNSSSYQRIQKFIIAKKYYPTYRSIIYFTKTFKINTNTAKVGLSICNLLNIETINVDGQLCRNIFEIQKLKNEMTPKGNNVPVKFWYNKNKRLLTVSCKLEKSGHFTHDPNIGFLSSIIFLLKENVDKVLVINHNLEKKHLKSKNKLYKNMQLMGKEIRFVFEDEIVTWEIKQKFKIPNNYFENLEFGEKLSMIKFNNYLEKNGYDVIFRNIAGCEREKIVYKNKNFTVPKKIKIPDIVFINKKNDLIIIEGESKKNVIKGLKQLETFSEFIIFINNLGINYNKIIMGVITDLECTINDERYLGYFHNSKNQKINEIIY